MNQTLERIAQSIFKHWFIDYEFPDENGKPYRSSGGKMVFDKELKRTIPNEWKVKKINKICTTQYGYTESASTKPIGPKFLRITDMNKEPWIDWNNVPYCTINKSNLKKYLLNKGDVVVSRMADPGKAGIIDEDVTAVFASYLIRLQTSSLPESYFLFYFLRSQQFLDYVYQVSGGSVQKNMNAKVITNVQCALPPIKLLNSFFKFVYIIRLNIVHNLNQKTNLIKIRDRLLPRLMSGKIRVPT